MYTTSRQLKDKADKRFVLQFVHVVVVIAILLSVSGCESEKKPLTAKEKNANYWKNVKELGGTPKGQLCFIFSTIAVFTAFRKYIVLMLCRFLAAIHRSTRLMMMTANFACAICVGAITFFLCGMDGCNNTDTVVESDPVAFREAVPPNGSEISPNETVIARFLLARRQLWEGFETPMLHHPVDP